MKREREIHFLACFSFPRKNDKVSVSVVKYAHRERGQCSNKKE